MLCLLFLLFLLALFSSCSRSLQDNQLRFGIKAAQKDLWDEAIFRWKKVLLSNPASAEAHNNLGVALAKQQKINEAIEHFSEALRINPAISGAHNNLRKALWLQKKTADNKK